MRYVVGDVTIAGMFGFDLHGHCCKSNGYSLWGYTCRKDCFVRRKCIYQRLETCRPVFGMYELSILVTNLSYFYIFHNASVEFLYMHKWRRRPVIVNTILWCNKGGLNLTYSFMSVCVIKIPHLYTQYCRHNKPIKRRPTVPVQFNLSRSNIFYRTDDQQM